LEWLSLALALVSSVLKSHAALQLENVALRHQIGVLQRSAKKRLPLNNADRLLWIGLSRVWTEWRSALKIVKPDTVIGWHRKAFRMFWTWKVGRGRPGRPARTAGPISGDSRADRRMSRENPGLGRAAHSRGTAEAWHRHRRDQREQVPDAQPKATLTNLANVPGKPPPNPRFR
jgi:hypothetical protein